MVLSQSNLRCLPLRRLPRPRTHRLGSRCHDSGGSRDTRRPGDERQDQPRIRATPCAPCSCAVLSKDSRIPPRAKTGTADRAANWLALHEILQALYARFLHERLRPDFKQAVAVAALVVLAIAADPAAAFARGNSTP